MYVNIGKQLEINDAVVGGVTQAVGNMVSISKT
jgi:hypothetical protein